MEEQNMENPFGVESTPEQQMSSEQQLKQIAEAVSEEVVVTEAVMPTQAVEYAGFWARVAANLVDGLVLIIPAIILQIIFGKGALGTLIGYILVWSYAIYMLNDRQATLGKMAVGLKVTTVDGGKPTLGKLALREIVGKFLDVITIGIGYLMVAFTEKKQGLHDKLADTVVIYDSARRRRKWLIAIAPIIISVIFILIVFTIYRTIMSVTIGGVNKSF